MRSSYRKSTMKALLFWLKSSLVLLLLAFFALEGKAQEEERGGKVLSDSLNEVLKTTSGKTKVQTLLGLSRKYTSTYPAEAFFMAEAALEEANKIQDKKLTAEAGIQMGLLHRNRGDYREGLALFLTALDEAEEIGDERLQAEAVHKMASSHLWLFEYKEALRYAKRDVELWTSLNDTLGLAKALNLNGLVLANLGNYESAFTILKKGLQLAKQLDNDDLRYKTMLNIGDTYLKQGKPDEALEWMQQSVQVAQQIGSKFGMAITNLKIGQAHAARQEYELAIGHLKSGLEQAKEIKSSSVARNAYKYLMETYQQMGRYEDAFDYLQKYQTLSDSLLTAESRRTIEQLKAQYRIEEKESENKLLREQNKIQNYQSYSLGTFSLLVLALGFLLWWRYREKTQANQALQEQNQEIQEKSIKIEEQSALIERKSQAIRDSVNYAKRIQDAVQINETDIFLRYPEYFIISKPRDIVSGDVYWFAQTEDYYLFAVADCTGHGIPGALMTILCNSLLNDILEDHADFSPEQMLYELDARLKKTLHQRISTINDGMEIALCALHPEKQEVTYVGAKMPLMYYTKSGERTLYKPSIFPIGGHEFKSEKTFEQVTFNFQDGDTIYMASDGYQDQFGGKRNRKFLRKNFRKMLDEIQPLSMEEQRLILEQRFEEWRGENEQTDDILIVGMRL